MDTTTTPPKQKEDDNLTSNLGDPTREKFWPAWLKEITVKVNTADDGYRINFNGIEIAESNSFNQHLKEFALYDEIEQRYRKAILQNDQATVRELEKTIKKVFSGRDLYLFLDGWNNGGPTAVSYTVKCGSTVVIDKKKDLTPPKDGRYWVYQNYKIVTRFHAQFFQKLPDSLLRKKVVPSAKEAFPN